MSMFFQSQAIEGWKHAFTAHTPNAAFVVRALPASCRMMGAVSCVTYRNLQQCFAP
jgi:hypothetical protein